MLKLSKLLMRTGMRRPSLFAERQIATVIVGMVFAIGVTAGGAMLFILGVLADGVIIDVEKVSVFEICPCCFLRRISSLTGPHIWHIPSLHSR